MDQPYTGNHARRRKNYNSSQSQCELPGWRQDLSPSKSGLDFGLSKCKVPITAQRSDIFSQPKYPVDSLPKLKPNTEYQKFRNESAKMRRRTKSSNEINKIAFGKKNYIVKSLDADIPDSPNTEETKRNFRYNQSLKNLYTKLEQIQPHKQSMLKPPPDDNEITYVQNKEWQKRPKLPPKPSSAVHAPSQHTLFYDTAKEEAQQNEAPYFKSLRTQIPGVVFDFTVSQYSDGIENFSNSDSSDKEDEGEQSLRSFKEDVEAMPESPKATLSSPTMDSNIESKSESPHISVMIPEYSLLADESIEADASPNFRVDIISRKRRVNTPTSTHDMESSEQSSELLEKRPTEQESENKRFHRKLKSRPDHPDTAKKAYLRKGSAEEIKRSRRKSRDTVYQYILEGERAFPADTRSSSTEYRSKAEIYIQTVESQDEEMNSFSMSREMTMEYQPNFQILNQQAPIPAGSIKSEQSVDPYMTEDFEVPGLQIKDSYDQQDSEQLKQKPENTIKTKVTFDEKQVKQVKDKKKDKQKATQEAMQKIEDEMKNARYEKLQQEFSRSIKEQNMASDIVEKTSVTIKEAEGSSESQIEQVESKVESIKEKASKILQETPSVPDCVLNELEQIQEVQVSEELSTLDKRGEFAASPQGEGLDDKAIENEQSIIKSVPSVNSIPEGFNTGESGHEGFNLADLKHQNVIHVENTKSSIFSQVQEPKRRQKEQQKEAPRKKNKKSNRSPRKTKTDKPIPSQVPEIHRYDHSQSLVTPEVRDNSQSEKLLPPLAIGIAAQSDGLALLSPQSQLSNHILSPQRSPTSSVRVSPQRSPKSVFDNASNNSRPASSINTSRPASSISIRSRQGSTSSIASRSPQRSPLSAARDKTKKSRGDSGAKTFRRKASKNGNLGALGFQFGSKVSDKLEARKISSRRGVRTATETASKRPKSKVKFKDSKKETSRTDDDIATLRLRTQSLPDRQVEDESEQVKPAAIPISYTDYAEAMLLKSGTAGTLVSEELRQLKGIMKGQKEVDLYFGYQGDHQFPIPKAKQKDREIEIQDIPLQMDAQNGEIFMRKNHFTTQKNLKLASSSRASSMLGTLTVNELGPIEQRERWLRDFQMKRYRSEVIRSRKTVEYTKTITKTPAQTKMTFTGITDRQIQKAIKTRDSMQSLSTSRSCKTVREPGPFPDPGTNEYFENIYSRIKGDLKMGRLRQSNRLSEDFDSKRIRGRLL